MLVVVAAIGGIAVSPTPFERRPFRVVACLAALTLALAGGQTIGESDTVSKPTPTPKPRTIATAKPQSGFGESQGGSVLVPTSVVAPPTIWVLGNNIRACSGWTAPDTASCMEAINAGGLQVTFGWKPCSQYGCITTV